MRTVSLVCFLVLPTTRTTTTRSWPRPWEPRFLTSPRRPPRSGSGARPTSSTPTPSTGRPLRAALALLALLALAATPVSAQDPDDPITAADAWHFTIAPYLWATGMEGTISFEGTPDILHEPVPTPPERAALRRRWANLIRRVYEVEPLVCRRCGAEMRVVSFITDPRVVKRIVDHLRKREGAARPPPPRVYQPVASSA